MKQSVSVLEAKKTTNLVRALQNSFRILELMGQSDAGVRVSDVARSLELPKATVFRILFTLEQIGQVRKDPVTRTYVLAQEIPALRRNEGRETLRRVARPYMDKLLARFEQTVNLAVLDRDQAFYTDIREGLRSIRMAANVNTYAPVHSTAVGKSIVAFLHPVEAEQILRRSPLGRLTPNTITSPPTLMKHFIQVREQGFAVDNEETEIGARCVGAPVFNAHGRPIGAISVSGPVSHITPKVAKQIATALVEASRAISSRLGFTERSAQNGW